MNEHVKVAKEKAEELLENSREFAEDTLDKAKDAYEDVEDSISLGIKKGRRMIKKYPLESALVGVAVGFILGVVLSKRN
jgi:ElaB/YqjD/DUF883 family membrane-anchored ribosome-binding protein